MANKFQKSIQERLELENQRQQNREAETDRPETEQVPAGTEYPYIVKPSRRAKNKTLYLDEDVLLALHREAQRQAVTDSRLAADILRRALRV